MQIIIVASSPSWISLIYFFSTIETLRNNQKLKKLRAAVNTVIAANRMKNLLGKNNHHHHHQ
jgi:hypothetical protein